LLVLVVTTVKVVVGRREAGRWPRVAGLLVVGVLVVAGRTHTGRRVLWRVLRTIVVSGAPKAAILGIVRPVRST
jgi:hypothetical protein